MFKQRYQLFLLLVFVTLSINPSVYAAEGKLLATAGLIQVEGSGGGGIVPWATLSGYDARDEISVSAVKTQVNLDDYRLDMLGANLSIFDRLELSVAEQRFDLLTLGGDISQHIIGLKYRLYGDVVYSDLPQLSLGLQHKQLQDKAIAQALGAKDTEGTDIYMSMTKVHLGAVAGFNTIWSGTLRATQANQLGLLGFGGAKNDEYELMLEASAGLLFSRYLALGAEYRQKPDNLGLGEERWMDVFLSYIPNKNFNITLAWADLGSIAGAKDQEGLYLSFNGQLW